jgi:hypothetical protein
MKEEYDMQREKNENDGKKMIIRWKNREIQL